MGYITKYGTIWGQIPQTAGRVYWVAPSASYTVEGRTYVASNDNDGLSPERAKLTLASAVSDAAASVGDVIVLLPGTHSWAASVALSKAGLTIMGLPSGASNPVRQRASITTSADDEVLNITAADVEVAYLHVIPVTTKAGIDLTTAADRAHIHDNSFDLFTAVADTGTKGVAVTAIAQKPLAVVVARNFFTSDGAQGAGIELGDAIRAVIEDNTFELTAGSWAVALSFEGVTSNSGTIRRNSFLAFQATMTDGILGGSDDGSSSRVMIYGNFFGAEVTTPIDNFGTNNANIAENYKMSLGIASGGVLWSSVT